MPLRIRTLLCASVLMSHVFIVSAQRQVPVDFMEQMNLEIEILEKCASHVIEGDFNSAFAEIDDRNAETALTRCAAVAGNLRNQGRSDLAGQFVLVAVEAFEDRKIAKESLDVQFGCFSKKAELVWEYLGDRDLAEEYSALANRAVERTNDKSKHDFKRFESIVDSLEKSRKGFPNKHSNGKLGGAQ